MRKEKLHTELIHTIQNPTCVVMDLDDTLCAPDWNIGWARADRFKPIEAMVELAHMLKGHGYDIVIATARPNISERQTIKWLEKHVPFYSALFMANASVKAKAETVKEQQLLAIERNWDIEFWCDDSPFNCDIIQAHGVTCLRPTRNDSYWFARAAA